MISILLLSSGRVGDGGGDSDREGSITPTNESPPSEEVLEESTTPKDKVIILLYVYVREGGCGGWEELGIIHIMTFTCTYVHLELNETILPNFILCLFFCFCVLRKPSILLTISLRQLSRRKWSLRRERLLTRQQRT